LFKDAPKALLEKVEQVVRLIRSKGCRHLFCNAEPSGYLRVARSIGSRIGRQIVRGILGSIFKGR